MITPGEACNLGLCIIALVAIWDAYRVRGREVDREAAHAGQLETLTRTLTAVRAERDEAERQSRAIAQLDGPLWRRLHDLCPSADASYGRERVVTVLETYVGELEHATIQPARDR